MLIGSQAFQETPKAHAPAIVLALVPHLAALGHDPDQRRAHGRGHGRRRARRRRARLGAGPGVLYDGLRVLGGGSISRRSDPGAIAVFIIEREFMKAGWFALAGAALTFFGFMHGEASASARTPMVALGYLSVAGILFGCARFAMERRTSRRRQALVTSAKVEVQAS